MQECILIIDDDANLHKTLSDILGAKGYTPTIAATGKIALDRVLEQTPVVALIDLRLEDMSGLKVLAEIKEHSPNTECIVLTGYASQTSAIEAINLGAYSYVQKPYDADQLLLTIRRAIEKRLAEQALRESEERYRSLVESSDDMIFSVDRGGVFRTAGGTRWRDFGLRPEDVVGRSLDELFGDEASYYHEHHQQVFNSGTPLTYEHIFEFAGETKTDLTTVYPLQNDHGKVHLVGVICRDITDRVRAEKRVQRLLDQQIAINRLALALGESRDLDRIYQVIYEHVRELMDTDAFIVSFYEQKSQLVRAGYIVTLGTTRDVGLCSHPPGREWIQHPKSGDPHR